MVFLKKNFVKTSNFFSSTCSLSYNAPLYLTDYCCERWLAISLNLIFAAPIGRNFPFFVKTLRRGHHLSCFKVSASIIVFGELLTEQNSINGLFEKQRIFLSPVYTVGLEMLKVLPLLDSTSFKWAVCLCNICQAFFPASFRHIKWNFRTFSTFLIVHCVSSFWRSISSITFLRSFHYC